MAAEVPRPLLVGEGLVMKRYLVDGLLFSSGLAGVLWLAYYRPLWGLVVSLGLLFFAGFRRNP